MNLYVDGYHAHDLVTKRSIKVILFMLSNTPITWISKSQKTLETSIYDYELVGSRIDREITLEVRYMLR
jgi:hypothetical protein